MFGIISDIEPICERLNALSEIVCKRSVLVGLGSLKKFVHLMFWGFAQLRHKREGWGAHTVALAQLG